MNENRDITDPGRDTICAIATPRGSGAIGIIRISGPQSLDIIQRLTRRRTLRPRRMHHAWIVSDASNRLMDEVLVCWYQGPRSYSGEDMVEIFAHGGTVNMQALLDRVSAQGARLAGPGEFTRRAYLNGKTDLLTAEGVASLIMAEDAVDLEQARALVQGRLGRLMAEVRRQVVEMTARVEAVLDFDEHESMEEIERSRLIAGGASIVEQVEEALAGCLSRRPGGRKSLVLTGAVNVGKSSLFNRLVGRERALVDAEPGTTRDFLEADILQGGQRLIVVDTAGYRAEGLSRLEALGLERAEERLETADMQVLVVDLCQEMTWAEVRPFAGLTLVVGNKQDLVGPGTEARFAARYAGYRTAVCSARLGTGVKDLLDLVGSLLATVQPSVEGRQGSLDRHCQALRLVRGHLEEGVLGLKEDRPPELVAVHLRACLREIEQLTGEGTSEEVLDEIFSRFCIGK